MLRFALASLIALTSLPAVLSQEPANRPSPRMNLRDFAEYHMYVDENGDGVIDASEDKRSDAAKQRLESLKKGVRVMKARKPSDPKSWFFQAAVHGVTDEAIIEAADRDPDVMQVQRQLYWNRCPHNGESSADFLVWHRAYLYYFERILREAAEDPSLSLPYWDYTGGETSFPRAFATADIQAGDIIPRNPLYSSDRDLAFTAGRTSLSEMVTTLALGRLESEKLFFGPTEDSGLAGGVYDSNPGTMGLIERRPHNDVHVAIGGVIGDDMAGLMAEVQTAAFDPIFWVHHANIDRLFSRWVRLPDRSWGYFPEVTWFVERPWYFFDADGTVKNNQRAYYLNDADLEILFDDVDTSAPAITDDLPYDISDVSTFLATLPRNLQVDETGKVGSQLAPVCECCRNKEVAVQLSAEASVSLPLNIVGEKNASKQLLSAKPRIARPERTPQTMLEVSFLPPDRVPSVGYEVLIGPKGADESELTSIGNLSMFGVRHHAKHGDSSGAVTQRFNMTKWMTIETNSLENLAVVVKPYALFDDAVLPTVRRSGQVKVTNVNIKIE